MHRILVVEDDPRTAETIKLYLEHDGFRARVASDRLSALNACRADLVARVFGLDYAGTERTVDVHIDNLRRKIERNPAQPALIATVFGAFNKWLGKRHDD